VYFMLTSQLSWVNMMKPLMIACSNMKHQDTGTSCLCCHFCSIVISMRTNYGCSYLILCTKALIPL
jgi:hypothetical protein